MCCIMNLFSSSAKIWGHNERQGNPEQDEMIISKIINDPSWDEKIYCYINAIFVLLGYEQINLTPEQTNGLANYLKRKVPKTGIGWCYFNRFDEVFAKYLSEDGREGDTMAAQIVYALDKLITMWFYERDVYDNNYYMNSRGDLSSYANWLWANTDNQVRDLLLKIFHIYTEECYTELLKDLADMVLTEEYLEKYNKRTPEGYTFVGSHGPFSHRN